MSPSIMALRPLLCLCIILAIISPMVSAEPPKRFAMGSVTDKPSKAIARNQAIADYIALKLSSFGYQSGLVKVASSAEELATLMKLGEVHLCSESLFSALTISELSDSDLLLRRWKKGTPTYSTVFITRSDSPIKNFSDLIGKRLVFEDRGSTSGFFVPASMLINAGYQLQLLKKMNDTVDPGKIGYLFTEDVASKKGEINIASWTFTGHVDAGAFSDGDWNSRKDTPHVMKKELRIFEQSIDFPRSIMLSSPTLDPNELEALKSVLMSMHENEMGLNALKAYQNTTKLDELDSDSLQSIERAKVLKQIVDRSLVATQS